MKQKPTDQSKIASFEAPPPNDNVLAEFNLPVDFPGLNALVVGTAVFETEQALRNKQVRKVIVPFYPSKGAKYDWLAIGRLINELLIFTLVEDVEIRFRKIENKQTSLDLERHERVVKNICLFSGGTDSYSGLLVARRDLGDVEAAFCAHADQSKTIHIVDELDRRVFRRKGIDIDKIPIPSIGASGYAQLRGFLYIMAAASLAHRLGSETIVVTECGPTMYQPRFSPLDSITMTTHPFVVRTAAKTATLLLRRDLKIITPFEDLTKAEVIAISPEKDGLKYTHSCISQRFGTHDGTCYGCVIRRLATIAAAVEDVHYKKNPIADSSANAGNLYSLLTFCYEILTDYKGMEEYETGTIETYKKRDLFRRFALDNFSAIHRLVSENKRVVRPIRDMYESLTQKLGPQIFENRLKQLTRAREKPLPNFKKEVQMNL